MVAYIHCPRMIQNPWKTVHTAREVQSWLFLIKKNGVVTATECFEGEKVELGDHGGFLWLLVNLEVVLGLDEVGQDMFGTGNPLKR